MDRGNSATVVGVALSLGSTGSWPARFATAVVNLVIGLCILTLVRSVLARTSERAPPVAGRSPEEHGAPTPPPDAR